jgi:two-component system, NarL family, response regulator DesR
VGFAAGQACVSHQIRLRNTRRNGARCRFTNAPPIAETDMMAVAEVTRGLIRVMVAEDMQILRDTLVSLLSLEEDIEVVAAVANGDEVIPAALAGRPDVAVVDIDMPGTDGLTVAARLHQQCPDCRVLILTVLGQPGNLRKALAAHVAGFLPKDVRAENLLAAIRQVSGGE